MPLKLSVCMVSGTVMGTDAMAWYMAAISAMALSRVLGRVRPKPGGLNSCARKLSSMKMTADVDSLGCLVDPSVQMVIFRSGGDWKVDPHKRL